MLQVSFKDNSIYFRKYPFKPACTYPNKTLRAHDIDAVCLNRFPPTLKTGKELLFIARKQVDKLQEFAERNELQSIKAYSNWNDLLEPFVDTEFTDEAKIRTQKRLNGNGFADAEIQAIRSEVERSVLKYNAIVWEWGSLGLYDVLRAMNRNVNSRKFNIFYWRAMAVEMRGSTS